MRPSYQLERFIFGLITVCAFSMPALGQSCSVGPMSGSYGSVSVLSGGSVDSAATFTVSCTGNANQTVRLCVEIGIGTAPCNVITNGNRNLCSGSNYLQQNFYTDAARTSVWGSWGQTVTAFGAGGVTANLTLNSSGAGSRNFTVYTRVMPSQQTAIPGSYTWTTTSPGLRYGYFDGSACPTGGGFTTNGNSTWTATVPPDATVSATNVNFGTVSLLTSSVTANGTVTVTATNTTPYQVQLTYGTGVGAGAGVRYMNGPGGMKLNYNLYRDAGRTQIWGDSLGVNTVDGTGDGTSQASTVYGLVPAQSTPAPGAYSDLITVVVNF